MSAYARQAMAKSSLPKDPSPIQRYGLAVTSVAIALGIAVILENYHLREAEFPLFLFALTLTAWFAGDGPAVLAVILSSLAFNYFFNEPFYSLYIKSDELPYYFFSFCSPHF
jgi:K+-sensing histidine kinase KdpD